MRRQPKNNGIVRSLIRACSISEFAICALVLVGLAAALAPQLSRAADHPAARPMTGTAAPKSGTLPPTPTPTPTAPGGTACLARVNS